MIFYSFLFISPCILLLFSHSTLLILYAPVYPYTTKSLAPISCVFFSSTFDGFIPSTIISYNPLPGKPQTYHLTCYIWKHLRLYSLLIASPSKLALSSLFIPSPRELIPTHIFHTVLCTSLTHKATKLCGHLLGGIK